MRKYIFFEAEGLIHTLPLDEALDYIERESGQPLGTDNVSKILQWFDNHYHDVLLKLVPFPPPMVSKEEEDGFLSPIF